MLLCFVDSGEYRHLRNYFDAGHPDDGDRKRQQFRVTHLQVFRYLDWDTGSRNKRNCLGGHAFKKSHDTNGQHIHHQPGDS